MAALQQDMLNACTAGDVAALQHLFEANNIQKGSKPVYISTADGPTPITDLLAAAIIKGNLNIVFLLLDTYKGITFYGGVITALLDHPNIKILEALYNYDNSIVQFEWDDYITTFVTEACKRPPEKIAPLLLFLIEHGATLDVGGLPNELAVHAALCGNQPLHIIEAMIKKGGPVTRAAMHQAVLRERTDVIESFMRFGVEGKPEDAQGILAAAEETGNVEIVKLVNAWTISWGQQTKSENSTMSQKLKQLFKRSS